MSRMNSHSTPIEILLVEDNPADARLAQEAFRDAKVANHISVVQDGMEALAFLHRAGPYAQSPRPDLILLDLNLPKKDGREVLAEIKQDPHLRRIPVVVMTTSQAERDIVTSYDLHANCYVCKPVDLDLFLAAVKSIEEFWLTIVKLPLDGDQPEAPAARPASQSRSPISHPIKPRTQPTLPAAPLPETALSNLPPSATIRVLLVEDNPADARLVVEALSEATSAAAGRPECANFAVECVARLATGLERLAQKPPDVLLLDLSLPDSQGLATFTRIFQQAPAVPILLLTGLNDGALAAQAIHAGAQDYLLKGQVTAPLLAQAIRYAIERGRLIAERAGKFDLMRRLNDVFMVREERVLDLKREVNSLLAATGQPVRYASVAGSGDSRPAVAIPSPAGVSEPKL